MTDPESRVALALDATELAAPDRGPVVPLLLLAEPSASALEWSFGSLSDTVYRFDFGGTLVGAATLRWRDDPSELVELAVDEAHQGRGIGRRIVDWLVAEGRRRGRRAIEVGTSSTSLGNIAFYQKCGFRPSAVRRDYFWYYRGEKRENGIPIRDMLVFRYDLVPEPQRVRRGQGAPRR
jgi:GNAT superfamily N-acetyltransferase